MDLLFTSCESKKMLICYGIVGGTSDRACQIEATLHELSIERDRLKNEQTKLERASRVSRQYIAHKVKMTHVELFS